MMSLFSLGWGGGRALIVSVLNLSPFLCAVKLTPPFSLLFLGQSPGCYWPGRGISYKRRTGAGARKEQ